MYFLPKDTRDPGHILPKYRGEFLQDCLRTNNVHFLTLKSRWDEWHGLLFHRLIDFDCLSCWHLLMDHSPVGRLESSSQGPHRISGEVQSAWESQKAGGPAEV